MSAENLAFAARAYLSEGPSTGMINKIEGGKRRPSVELMEAIAKVLEVEPTVFAEYRLAKTRRLFDEREVGLARALGHLAAVEDSLDASLEVAAGDAPSAQAARRGYRGSRAQQDRRRAR